MIPYLVPPPVKHLKNFDFIKGFCRVKDEHKVNYTLLTY